MRHIPSIVPSAGNGLLCRLNYGEYKPFHVFAPAPLSGPTSVVIGQVSKVRKDDSVPLCTEILLTDLRSTCDIQLANTSSYREIGAASRFVRVEHELWSNLLVKLLGCEEAQRDSSLFERSAFLMRLLCCFGNVYLYEIESVSDL